jgi:hypothetical protein
MNNIQVFCNVDEQGKIIEFVAGINLAPGKPYDRFFVIDNQDALSRMDLTINELEQWQQDWNNRNISQG